MPVKATRRIAKFRDRFVQLKYFFRNSHHSLQLLVLAVRWNIPGRPKKPRNPGKATGYYRWLTCRLIPYPFFRVPTFPYNRSKP